MAKKTEPTVNVLESSFKGFHVDPNALTIVGLDTKDGTDHPLFDERIYLPIDDGLVKNIASVGVKKPVIIRKNGPAFEVVDGRQRVRHAREANKLLAKEGSELIRVKAILESGDDATVFGTMISTNIHREDSPLNKARKIERYRAMGRTKEEAALAFGVTTKTIENLEKLLDLDPKVQEKIESGKISAYAAAELSKLDRKEQVKKIEELEKTGGKLTGSRIKKAKNTGDAEPKKKAPGRDAIRSVLAHENAKTALSEQVRMALAWSLGEVDADKVDGLEELLTVSEPLPAEKKAKKSQDAAATADDGAATSSPDPEPVVAPKAAKAKKAEKAVKAAPAPKAKATKAKPVKTAKVAAKGKPVAKASGKKASARS